MSDTSTPFGAILTNSFGERYFPAINGEAFSRIGSESYFQRHFGPVIDRKDALNLIPGTDGGLLVNWVINRKIAEGSRVIFIEYPELLERLYDEAILPRELPSHIAVTTPDEWMKKAEEFSIRDYFYIGNVYPWRSMAAIDGYHEGYIKLWNDFDEHLGQFHISVGQEIGTRIFILRCLENLAENRTPVHIMDQAFKGRTAVLLGGGPSLDESFAWVKKHRDHLVVMAVARIAKQLLRENIVPDMIFAIDPHDIIFHQSKDILHFHEKSLLVSMYHLNPRLVGMWQGRILYMGVMFPWFSPHNPSPRNYPGITVSHQALGAALEMGFSRVVLGGLDLCFSKEGFTHARGSLEMATGPYVHRSELWVETNGGWRAETSSDFFSAIPALKSLAEYAKTKECEIVNPAAAAAKIEGVAFRSWDLIDIPQETTIAWDVIQQILPKETSKSRVDHCKLVEKELMRIRVEVRKIRKLTAEAVDCNDRLFGRKGRPPDFKYKKRMDKIESILDEEHKEISRFVKKWSVGDFLKLSRPDKTREWTDEEIETTGRRYYETYRDSSTNVLKTLDDSLARVMARMEEDKPNPQYKRILDQYEKDGQHGRVAVLLNKIGQKAAEFPENISKRLETCQNEFASVMEQTETDYKEHCKNRLASPRAVRSKIMAMFQYEEIDRLQHFMEGINQGTMEEKDQFVHLIRGLLAEKESDFDQALKWFRQISFDPLVIEGWQRQMTIYLRQNELVSACAVAKRLAENSFLHFPFFADLLRLTGDKKKAATVYKEYTNVVKDDFVTMIKQARLLVELEEWDGAVDCCQAILDKDHGHREAGLLLEKAKVHAAEKLS